MAPLADEEPTMPKLNDTHLILLANAAQQDGGRLHPLPASLLENDTTRARADKAIEQLIGCGLVEEREAVSAAEICRKDGDIGYGLFITAIGLTAIGLGREPNDGAAPPPLAPSTPKAERQTKSGAVLALVERNEGATLAELIAATGWLPHTTRAALTRLRKKGHAIEKSKRGDVTCYKVAA